MIKNIKIFPNNQDKSLKLAKLIKEQLIANDFNVVNNNYQLGLAVGGDGSFLRMVKDNNFNSDIFYVGVNSGHLGFLQELKESDISKLIYELKNDKYKIEDIGIQETKINHNNETSHFYSLNDIVVRSQDLKVIKLNISFDNDYLETFAGDGVLIATSTGSTAYNISLGGSIVYNTFKSLQITPIGPMSSSAYRSLITSVVIPDKMMIKIEPVNKQDLIIQIDGENKIYDGVESIETKIDQKQIKCLRLSHYNFPQKINEKLLK